jgi:subtilisin-like proprotein convertase family protein
MKKYLSLLILLISPLFLIAQSWEILQESNVQRSGDRKITPTLYTLAKLSDKAMKDQLWKSPIESSDNRNSNSIIEVMLSDGTLDEFQIVEYKMMEEELARKFPDFKTFYGISKTEQSRIIRIDYTTNGFRAVITDYTGQTYIDPYQTSDKEHRIIYKKENIRAGEDWVCETESDNVKVSESVDRFAGDCMLRTYRMACAATGEYTAFHGGTVSDGLAAIVTAFNRVNQIYEQEVASRFELVANNDQLVFTNAGTDPYTNNDGAVMLNQNQTTVDNIIGNGAYDIGHVFSTGGGGIASLRSLCADGNKARGVTGQGAPTGDPFWVDYVAHEIGHQFGGNHTQNNSCNRNGETAVEPGSASTIMGYAGICAPNVQSNSDPYFHAISIGEMSAHITSTNCAVVTNFGNTAPVVTNLSNYTVPKSTYLALEASASDADEDVLTYCWEQIDNEVATMPPVSTNSAGPAFRSLNPSNEAIRYLPSIDNIINNSTDTWEVLPSVARTMNFRVTVRDKVFVPGCTDETDMTITVDGGSGPFLVTNSSIPSVVNEGQSITVEWDVAGTDLAPVNCSDVEIRLSVDGGLTYPTVLLSSTTNDGSAVVSIPLGITSTARLMVKCADNIFFDINDSDFEIEPGLDGFTMALDPNSAEQCNDQQLSFDINTTAFGGFSTPIDLTMTGTPAGSNVSFSQNPVTPGGTSTVSISNFGSNSGNFVLDVQGVAATFTRNQSFNLTLGENVVAPSLSSPANNATDVALSPTLTWNLISSASTYDYELRTAPNGGGTLIQSGTVTGNSVAVASSLAPTTLYFWRVRSSSICNTSAFSNDFSFTTANITEVCQSFTAAVTPVNIRRGRANNPSIAFADFAVGLDETISDVNVLDITGTHGNVGDLAFVLVSPNATQVILQDFLDCGNVDDFDMGFDDEASLTMVDCPPTQNNTYQPTDNLSSINGENASGDWALAVFNFGATIGLLTNAEIEVCYLTTAAPCNLNVTSTNASGPGSLQNAISCATSGDVINVNTGANTIINLAGAGLTIEKNLTIQANPADNIIIRYNGSSSALEVLENFNLTISGITFEQETIPKDSNARELKYRRETRKLH